MGAVYSDGRQLTVAALSRILLQLELSGSVGRLPDGGHAIVNRS
ncbi:MAG: hypothetical protein HQL91_11695 [Magnetococcales bacterium]|nr:hypothetical protein [Magnetococcales bacterium]